MHRQRKRIRLDRHLYKEPQTLVAVTIGTNNRRPIFSNDLLTSRAIDLLKTRASEMDVSIIAFCFMPDHVHLLLSPGLMGDLVEFIRDYKSRTTRLCWEHGIHGKVWQRSFYDHILREFDDPMKHVRYILENPVREQMVDSFSEYPWCGSFEYDVFEAEFWEVDSFDR
jgi:putative transposase